jgi:glycine cleavage system H lipoate-binding protein
MTKSVYRTVQGKMIDMGKLVLQNESIKAVGNMNVNARGDLVDDHNRVIASKSQQVNKQYNRQVSNQPTRTK